MLIAIRVDGNSLIGLGHLLRMRTLALALQGLGANVMFFSRDRLDLAPGFILAAVPGDLSPEQECYWMRDQLEQSKADMLVIDSYDYGEKELAIVADFPQVSVYIDDLNRHSFMVDFVVNGNLYAKDMIYQGSSRFLLGPEYLLLRPEFAAAPKLDGSRPVQNVLLMLGGADLTNTTPKVLRMLKLYPRFTGYFWQVVIGPAYTNQKEIMAEAAGFDNVFCSVSPALEKLIPCCDLAISASGSSIYELAVVGVPVLAVITADNQVRLAEKVQKLGTGINLGWHDVFREENLFQGLDILLDNQELRRSMSAIGKKLVNGLGAENTAKALLIENGKRKIENY